MCTDTANEQQFETLRDELAACTDPDRRYELAMERCIKVDGRTDETLELKLKIAFWVIPKQSSNCRNNFPMPDTWT